MDETPQTEQVNLGGRPTKLTEDFLAAAEEILDDGDNVVIHTDQDLLFLINEKLEPDAQISDATLENWKAGKFSDDERGERFLGLMKKALIRERRNLFIDLKSERPAWQKWAWIIERKFKDWRMPTKLQVGGDPENPSAIQVSVINFSGASGTVTPPPPVQVQPPIISAPTV